MYKVGMQVYYKGSVHWIVSVAGPILELALSRGGAGSFYTTEDYVVGIQRIEV